MDLPRLGQGIASQLLVRRADYTAKSKFVAGSYEFAIGIVLASFDLIDCGDFAG